MKKLSVYYDNTLTGYLIENSSHQLCFKYNSDWLKIALVIALSPELPLSDQLFMGDEVESFFENLLPEGDILDFISQVTHISANNTFGLLERFGGDTVGDFSILPENLEPSSEYHYLPVTTNKIKKSISPYQK